MSMSLLECVYNYVSNEWVHLFHKGVCVSIIIAMHLLQWNIVLSIELILTYFS